MSTHPEKTRERITGHPAPRDVPWTDFIAMWEAIADRVEQESGDRLAVDMNGHRQVFRRQKDGRVGIEDVERARHLLAAHESTEGQGSLIVLTLTDEDARLYDFDLDAHDVETTATKHERNPDPRGHHMRTVERKTGRDDDADLKRFFTDLAELLRKDAAGRPVVLLGHGAGKADAAAQFEEYLQKHEPQLAGTITARARVDLSALDEAGIEKAAQQAAGR